MELRERRGVQLLDHPQHHPRFILRRFFVRRKGDALEGDAVAACVAVLAADAERERELAHPLDQPFAADVLRKELKVLAFPRRLRRLCRDAGGKREDESTNGHGRAPHRSSSCAVCGVRLQRTSARNNRRSGCSCGGVTFDQTAAADSLRGVFVLPLDGRPLGGPISCGRSVTSGRVDVERRGTSRSEHGANRWV